MNTDSMNPMFSTPAMTDVFSQTRQLRAMAHFEWALSCALEKYGLAEIGSGEALHRHLNAQFIDRDALESVAIGAGNIAIPFLQQLTTKVESENASAAKSIHLGATSQDVLDTALVLQIREALELVLDSMRRLESVVAKLTRAHAETAMTGRTWLQPGPPTTFGLKMAGILSALRRHRDRIQTAKQQNLQLQFGGAVGTLAALGENGGHVSKEVARILNLKEPEIPWHTHRDSLVALACALAVLAGTLGKFAKDVALLMQSEVGEAAEIGQEGNGGSSTMPQKRNPVACATVLACSARLPGLISTLLSAMPQEHERGLGLWQAEWETLPEVFRLTACALDRAVEIAEGLEVDAARMADNLDALCGMNQAEAASIALASKMGRKEAHELLRSASIKATESGQHLAAVLKATPEVRSLLSDQEIDRLLTPTEYLGSALRFIRRVLGDADAGR